MKPEILNEQIISFISQHLQIPIEKIKFTSSLGRDLDMDSLDLVDVIVGLQDLYDITIEEYEIGFMRAVSNICQSVEYHLSKKQ
jgi:acyl carrier protein